MRVLRFLFQPRWFRPDRLDFWAEVLVLFLSIFLWLSIVFYLILDHLPPEAIKAMNVTLPQTRPELVIITATIAGATLSVWALLDPIRRDRFTDIGRRLILGAILVLLFHLFFVLSEVLRVDPSHRELSLPGFGRFLIYYTAVIGIFGGAYALSSGITDLLSMLLMGYVRQFVFRLRRLILNATHKCVQLTKCFRCFIRELRNFCCNIVKFLGRCFLKIFKCSRKYCRELPKLLKKCR
jgi:hypothetical protein